MRSSSDTGPWSIFVLGDSISIHYGPYFAKALGSDWVYNRKGGLRHEMRDADSGEGSNGGDSRNVLGYLERELGSGRLAPDVLLLNCGLHDIKRTGSGAAPLQVSIEEYTENLRAAVMALQARSIGVIWVRTTPVWDAWHNEKNRPSFSRFEVDRLAYDAGALEVMRQFGVPVVDLPGFTNAIADDPDELLCDHIHFHESVREKQGIFLAGWLNAFKTLRTV